MATIQGRHGALGNDDMTQEAVDIIQEALLAHEKIAKQAMSTKKSYEGASGGQRVQCHTPV